MKPLVVLAIIAVLVLPVGLLIKRKLNFSLGCFYALLGLATIGDLSGGGASRVMTVPQIVVGIWAFAAAAGLEYALRRDYRLAIISALILTCFGFAIHVAAEHGAFA